jgi:hypothetical protein
VFMMELGAFGGLVANNVSLYRVMLRGWVSPVAYFKLTNHLALRECLVMLGCSLVQ